MPERRAVLLPILLLAMMASSFQLFAIAVLAVDLIDEFGLSRTAIGLLGSLNTFVGATTAPTIGRLTDRIGTRLSIIILLTVSAIGMALTALSGSWIMLAVAAVISGLPQGWGNPATNALIAERVPVSQQGTVTGIKQSGVQFSVFLSGLTLPGLAAAVGWRGAVAGYAVIFLIAAIVAGLRLGPAPAANPDATTDDLIAPATKLPIPSFIWRLTLYAFLSGTAGGIISRFLPLWANETVGISVVGAGGIVALGGALGIVARVWVGRLAQTRMAATPLLSLLAIVGAAYSGILLVTQTIGAWVLWPAAALFALGIAAWNTVAMLAVITTTPKAGAGRASGIVMVGFLGGLTVGSPIAGLVVDRWGSFQPVWVGTLALALAASVVINPRFTKRTTKA